MNLMKPREEMAALVRLDNKGYEYHIQDVSKLTTKNKYLTNVLTINNRKIQELEMRIECLENRLKTEQKQESKYVTVLGE